MLIQRIADQDLLNSRREMQRLQQHLNRLFQYADHQPATQEYSTSQEFPAINVWTSPDEVIVRAELPGIDSADVEISLVNDTLTIKGSKNPETLQNGERCHRQERGYGQFTRTLQLPFSVEADKVQARFTTGVLQITLPRAEADKARKIAVKYE